MEVLRKELVRDLRDAKDRLEVAAATSEQQRAARTGRLFVEQQCELMRRVQAGRRGAPPLEAALVALERLVDTQERAWQQLLRAQVEVQGSAAELAARVERTVERARELEHVLREEWVPKAKFHAALTDAFEEELQQARQLGPPVVAPAVTEVPSLAEVRLAPEEGEQEELERFFEEEEEEEEHEAQ